MFMLYEIFIWNCFAKLLYFCMNVFFIGIIRNSYLTPARLVCLLPVFFSFLPRRTDFTAYLRKNYFLVCARWYWQSLAAHSEGFPGTLWNCPPPREALEASSCHKFHHKNTLQSTNYIFGEIGHQPPRQIFIFNHHDHVRIPVIMCGFQWISIYVFVNVNIQYYRLLNVNSRGQLETRRRDESQQKLIFSSQSWGFFAENDALIMTKRARSVLKYTTGLNAFSCFPLFWQTACRKVSAKSLCSGFLVYKGVLSLEQASSHQSSINNLSPSLTAHGI